MVIIGALSAIAKGVAQEYAKAGSRFFLVARNEEALLELAKELQTLGAVQCVVYVADVRQRDSHADVVQRCVADLGRIDVVLIAHGVYPDREITASDVDIMLDSFMTNAVSTISYMHRFGDVLKQQAHGLLAVLSSVAGDRGRLKNYHYGSAKAAVSAYASGQRAELADHNVRVLTIKPGPVSTPMTTHTDMPLQVSVSRVVPDIVRGIEEQRCVVYTPWYWRWIMLVVRMIPERLFMKLKR